MSETSQEVRGKETKPSDGDQIASWATKNKDAVSLLAVGVAASYAYGWLIQHLASLSLGIGELPTAKEDAVSAGVFFLLGPAMPSLGLLSYGSVRARIRRSVLGGLIGVVSNLPFRSLITLNPPTNDATLDYLFYLGGSFVTVALCACLAFTAKRQRTLQNFAGIFSSVLATVVMACIYAQTVARWLPPPMGGVSVFAAKLTTTDGAISPIYVIALDDKSLVYAPREIGCRHHHYFLGQVRNKEPRRIRADDVKTLVREPSVPYFQKESGGCAEGEEQSESAREGATPRPEIKGLKVKSTGDKNERR